MLKTLNDCYAAEKSPVLDLYYCKFIKAFPKQLKFSLKTLCPLAFCNGITFILTYFLSVLFFTVSFEGFYLIAWSVKIGACWICGIYPLLISIHTSLTNLWMPFKCWWHKYLYHLFTFLCWDHEIRTQVQYWKFKMDV